MPSNTVFDDIYARNVHADSLMLNSGTAIGSYEEYAGIHTFDGTWASSIAVDVNITRIGSLCTLRIGSAFSAGDTSDQLSCLSEPIPERFRPATTAEFPVRVQDNGSATYGTLRVFANGIVVFNPGADTLTSFSPIGGLNGWYDVTVTYDLRSI